VVKNARGTVPKGVEEELRMKINETIEVNGNIIR
jgi:hypothetical protein